MEDLFRIGVFSNTHGVRGEIKVFPTTDDIKRFDYLKEVVMDCKKDGMKAFTVSSVKYFKNLVILKFKDVDNINDIEKYKGADIFVTRENAIPLEEDEFYIADIIGAKVVSDEGDELGELTDVLQTGANDVYVVKMKNGKDGLFPAIPDCIKDVDVENKILTVHIMPGLLD